jgi:sugar phosphate isomerase/epimerase
VRLALQGGLVPGTIEQFTDEVAEQIASLGFSGVACHLGFYGGTWAPPESVTSEHCRVVRDRLARHGLQVAYSWSFWSSLVNADPALRAQAVTISQGALRVARDLGAPCVVSGAGSNDARSGWYPHPENFTDASLARLIRSVREIAPTAEHYGVQFVLKGHTLSTLNTPEKMKLVIDAVGSPMVKGGADPVNWMTLEHVYDTSGFIRHIFDVLGDDLVIAHAKDVFLESRLVLHLTEAVPGQGWMDYATYLRLFEERCPEGWMVIEHVSADDTAAAKRHLDTVVAEQGIVPRH